MRKSRNVGTPPSIAPGRSPAGITISHSFISDASCAGVKNESFDAQTVSAGVVSTLREIYSLRAFGATVAVSDLGGRVWAASGGAAARRWTKDLLFMGLTCECNRSGDRPSFAVW